MGEILGGPEPWEPNHNNNYLGQINKFGFRHNRRYRPPPTRYIYLNVMAQKDELDGGGADRPNEWDQANNNQGRGNQS